MSHRVAYRYRLEGSRFMPGSRWAELEVSVLDPEEIARRVHRIEALGDAIADFEGAESVRVEIRVGEQPAKGEPDGRSYWWGRLDRRRTIRERGGHGPWIWEVL